MKPGHGAPTLLGHLEGDAVQADRSFEAERQRAQALLEACPVLGANEVGEYSYELADATECLELIAALRDLEPEVHVEWPHGKPMKLRGRASRRALRGNVSRASDFCRGRAAKAGSRGVSLGKSSLSVLQGLFAEGSGFELDQSSEQFRQQLQTAFERQARVPRTLQAELRGYQVEGFRWLARLAEALVFSQFVDMLSLARQALDQKNINYQYLDGKTPQAPRKAAVDAFQSGDGDLFLISLRAGGFGLNLTGADYVIHLDPWWSPAVEAQASDRAHRIGQTRPVTVYRLITTHTVEDRIVDLHRTKRELADSLLEESDRAAKLTVDELRSLLEG